ncbi:MAG: hypothetical protein V3U75_02870 [Methylococcaceae bacterium]
MNKILTLLVVCIALSTGLSAANAEEPYVLSLEQMGSVTAGGLRDLSFNFDFGRQGLLFNNSRNDLVELETETGTLTSTIQVNSAGFRLFSTNIQRTGGFNTSFTFN